MDYLIKLIDGKIYDVHDDCSCCGGCPTCDYGSEYTNNIIFNMEKYEFSICATKMYEYTISEGWLMRTMLRNITDIEAMTELDFINWFTNEVKKICPEEKLYGRDTYGVTTKIIEKN